MPPKPTNWRMYSKMAIAGGACCFGGPALIYYVSPTEAELFSRYNPDLQKRSLENRLQKQEDFDHFVNKLKEYSKSDKPIWAVREDDERLNAKSKMADQMRLVEEMRRRKEEMRKDGIQGVPGGSL